MSATSDDYMRSHLVTRFACAQCGDVLKLAYRGARPQSVEDGITGAAKVEVAVLIWPCEKCYGEAVEPIKAMRAALGLPPLSTNSSRSE